MQNASEHDIDDISLHDIYIYQTIAMLQNNYRKLFECLSSVDAIIDPDFISHKPTLSNNLNSIFDRRLGILIKAEDGSYFHARPVNNNELLIFILLTIPVFCKICINQLWTTCYHSDFLGTSGFCFDLALQYYGISDTLSF